MTTTGFESWEKKVLKGSDADSVSHLEAPLPGTDSTYPMLGEDTLSPGEVGNFSWVTRIVLEEEFSDSQMEALHDPFTELLIGNPLEEQPLESILRASRVGKEGRVRVDLSLLKNVAEIRRLRTSHPKLTRWVLVTDESVDSEPEKLVGETIRMLTGILAGCEVLEVRRQKGEPFSSIWARQNVARLLAHESQMRELPDPVAGAGLFQEIQKRLQFRH